MVVYPNYAIFDTPLSTIYGSNLPACLRALKFGRPNGTYRWLEILKLAFCSPFVSCKPIMLLSFHTLFMDKLNALGPTFFFLWMICSAFSLASQRDRVECYSSSLLRCHLFHDLPVLLIVPLVSCQALVYRVLLCAETPNCSLSLVQFLHVTTVLIEPITFISTRMLQFLSWLLEFKKSTPRALILHLCCDTFALRPLKWPNFYVSTEDFDRWLVEEHPVSLLITWGFPQKKFRKCGLLMTVQLDLRNRF